MLDPIPCPECEKGTLKTVWAEQVTPLQTSRHTWETDAMYYELECTHCHCHHWTQVCLTGCVITQETVDIMNACKGQEAGIMRTRHFTQEQIDQFHLDMCDGGKPEPIEGNLNPLYGKSTYGG